MIDVAVLPGFVAVILLFLIPPGPDMAYMIAVGLASGRRAAARAILGIGTGMAIFAVAVVVGVGGLAQSHPALLDTIKVLGAIYLLWLAWTTIREARNSSRGRPGADLERPYVRGLLVSLTNPKLILFFLAVLPQFMGHARQPELQLAMLGAVNVAMEVLLYGAIGMAAGSLHARFSRSKKAGTALHYVAAVIYVVLAATILVQTGSRFIADY